MNTQTNETAFETYVEQMLLAKGWQQGMAGDWEKDRALFPRLITGFIATTQPDLWAAMRGQHGAQLERLLIDTLVRELAIKGSLYVLRHGFKSTGLPPARERRNPTRDLTGKIGSIR